VRYQQAAIDLMAPQLGHEKFDAATLFDRRFEALAARGFSQGDKTALASR